MVVEKMDERVDVGDDDGLQSVGCPREAELGVAPRSRESWAASSVQQSLASTEHNYNFSMPCFRNSCHSYRKSVNIMKQLGFKQRHGLPTELAINVKETSHYNNGFAGLSLVFTQSPSTLIIFAGIIYQKTGTWIKCRGSTGEPCLSSWGLNA